MNSYGQNAKRRQIKEVVREEILKQAEHYDMCVLIALHRDFGFGAERLKRFYRSFSETYRLFKDRYFDKDDMRIFGERGDSYELKKALCDIGFDYDKEVKRMIEGESA